MKRKKKGAAVLVGFLLLGLAGLLAFRDREPQYNGMGLGRYIDEKFAAYQFNEVLKAARATGDAGFRYLIREMRRNPLTELEIKASPHSPVSVQKLLPSQNAYQNRRIRAALILNQLGTNAAVALPDALAIVESDGPSGLRPNCLQLVGKFAPRTKYESRALKSLLYIAESGNRDERKIATLALGAFTNHAVEVAPVLVRALKRPGLYDPCAAALMRIGPLAIPALKQEAAKEVFHVRPATLVLEHMGVAAPLLMQSGPSEGQGTARGQITGADSLTRTQE